MLSMMSAKQLINWKAYFSIVPFTQDREDIRAGIIASTIVNMLKGKKGKNATVDDFIPKWRKPREKVSSVAQLAAKVDVLRVLFDRSLPV